MDTQQIQYHHDHRMKIVVFQFNRKHRILWFIAFPVFSENTSASFWNIRNSKYAENKANWT